MPYPIPEVLIASLKKSLDSVGCPAELELPCTGACGPMLGAASFGGESDGRGLERRK